MLVGWRAVNAPAVVKKERERRKGRRKRGASKNVAVLRG